MEILSKRSSRPTLAEILSSEIHQEIHQTNSHSSTGLHTYSTTRKRWDSTPLPQSEVVRWGVTASLPTPVAYEYNKQSVLKSIRNKGATREMLHVNGIAVPEILASIYDIEDGNRYVIRPQQHQRGRGFKVLSGVQLKNDETTLRKWYSGEVYISRYYPKTTEWRVHVAHGKVLAVQQKLQTSDDNESLCDRGEAMNWNHEAGYVFSPVRWKQYRKEIVRLAVDTISVLGLDFGAVDLLADPDDDSFSLVVVCEVNTAPQLEGYTAERYAEYFSWLSRTGERRHFDIPVGTSPRHYVFKHRELRDSNYDFNFKEENNV